MRALLLAAGHGTRLRPLTDRTPKCLVQIQGRPLLDYWLDLLLGGDTVERVLINTHHLRERVVDHVAASPWKARVDLVDEPELLGTGGTVKANRAYFGSGDALVAHADNLTDAGLGELVAAHRRRPGDVAMTMLAFRSDSPSSCGILELDGRGVVQAFHEKVDAPPGNLANGAVYVLSPAVLDAVAALSATVIDLSTEVIPRFIGRILAVETDAYFRDIGTAESLARAEAEFGRRPTALR